MEVLRVTDDLLVDLRLHGIKQSLSSRLHQAQTEQASIEDFLNLILHDEKEFRHNAKIKRLTKRAAFKQSASLEGFDYSQKRGVEKRMLADLATGRFVDEGTNLMISGPTGVGKSFLATAIGNHMCRLGKSVTFFRMNSLIEKTHLERAKGTYLNLLRRMSAQDLIILDDFGIKPLEPTEFQDLYDMIDERGDEKSLIITTQVPPENWNEIVPDPVTCEAITDRIVSQAINIKMRGVSYRQKRKKTNELDKV